MNRAVLILGAASAIARSAANDFAAKGCPLFLAGRNQDELKRLASDIKIRHQTDVKIGLFDAEAFDTHYDFLQNVIHQMNGLDGVVIGFGDLGDHKKAIIDFKQALHIINCNYVGACSIISHCANYLGQQESGFIIALTSVAGDRGRQSNYIYGSAKAGLNTFLEGLRNRLFHANVRVITIKPGLVDTPMTFGRINFFLMASPESVGKKIVKISEQSKDIAYVPAFWRYLMMVVRFLPECIFKRLKF
jgi:decaprenylphospho-beta-D-erythro-pentofuranosid-2-ulose 2-reductase